MSVLLLLTWFASTTVDAQDGGTTHRLRQIESECSLEPGTLSVHGASVWIQNAQEQPTTRTNCALRRLNDAGPGIVDTERKGHSANHLIPLEAARCGLKPDQFAWKADGEGRWRADITPKGDLDASSFRSMKCFLDWAQKSGVRIGFISEPPPAPNPKP